MRGPYHVATKTEGQVVALTAALAEKKERLDAATSAGINTTPLKRQIAQIESDLATARRRSFTPCRAGRTHSARRRQ
jgi:predicted  nucleic acid-binding Zn-ribbon protein